MISAGFQIAYKSLAYCRSPSPYDEYHSLGSSLSPIRSLVVDDSQISASYDGLSIHSIRDELCYYIKIGDLANIKTMFALHSKDRIEGCWKLNNLKFVSPIHDAAESGQMEVLKWLLSPSIGFDINERTSVCFLCFICLETCGHRGKSMINDFDKMSESTCTFDAISVVPKSECSHLRSLLCYSLNAQLITLFVCNSVHLSPSICLCPLVFVHIPKQFLLCSPPIMFSFDPKPHAICSYSLIFNIFTETQGRF